MNDAGIAIIKKYESLRLEAYRDPIGILSIGYGHVIIPGEKLTDITEEEADDLLATDIALRATWIPHFIKVPLNNNHFSALVSLVFNCGVEPLAHTLGLLLNEGDYGGAGRQFLRWNHAGGKVLPGLTARREAERELFEKPVDEALPWTRKP